MLTQSLFSQLKWDIFHHLVYSPDLAPSHYRFIPGLKCDVGGRHFATEKDWQSVVSKFFAKQGTKWNSAGIHKLILCYNKCLDKQGDYIEK